MKRLLSGMRPTGCMHIGNYVGALRNWVALQEKYDCFYMVADWHALMSEYNHPAAVKENTYVVVAEWLACGLDPKRCVLFRHSDVPQHLELMMVFGNLIKLGRLYRCPTYKERLRQPDGANLTNYTFLGYPVLQAADILIYRAAVVPVGEDQLPHLEITRELARRFNALYSEVFPEPEALLTPVPRLGGLDGRKMSKTYNNTINLADEPDKIRNKVMAALTDIKRARRKDPGHPDECNLFPWWQAMFSDEAEKIRPQCEAAQIGCVDCKRNLAEKLVAFLEPIRQRRERLLRSRSSIDEILVEGAKKAKEVAEETMRLVREAMGL